MLAKKIRKWPLSVAFVAYKSERLCNPVLGQREKAATLSQNFKDSGKGSKE